MKTIKSLFLAALVMLFAVTASPAWAQDTVVYHIDNAEAQALKGLRNIRNHLDTDPTAQITVVTHANGIDFLMEGAKADNGTQFAPLVSALTARGVKFEICEITLKNRNLKKDQFVMDAGFTPSGVDSSAQAAASATGKPSATSKVTSRGAQAGTSNCGNTVAATWISSQPTTR